MGPKTKMKPSPPTPPSASPQRGRVIQGPWPPPPPRLEGQAFDALSPDRQASTLRFALRDLRRYLSDLTPNELGWLRAQLGPGPVRVNELDPAQRARVAGVVLLILRRRAGWAA